MSKSEQASRTGASASGLSVTGAPSAAGTSSLDPAASAAAGLLAQLSVRSAADTEDGLTYVTADQPGYSRIRKGRNFRYLNTAGRAIRDKAILARLRKLVIPPAWSEVWICPNAHGHIQAVGRDARGRRQYIYHPAFRAAREASKFLHMAAFAAALPRLRRQVLRDMARPRLDRRKVVATVTFLLEVTLIRIGNSAYARTNKSYGITTLRNPHVKVEGTEIRFKFRGKSGRLWNVQLSSRRAARTIRACQELPGQLLFQYENDRGELTAVTSTDINDYLREVTGKDITAKDYRTWAGTVLAAKMFHELVVAAEATSLTGRKKQLRDVINQVAYQLGNTSTICRKCYIHPDIQNAFLAGKFKLQLADPASPSRPKGSGLDVYEAAVLAFLRGFKRKGRPPA